MECMHCSLLAVDDSCLTNEKALCKDDQTIYCCSDCPLVKSICYIRGTIYQISDPIVEVRVNSEANGILITTSSDTNQPYCFVQIHRITSAGFSYLGPIQTCLPMPGEVYKNVATTTFHPDTAVSNQFTITIDSQGGLYIFNHKAYNSTVYIPLKIYGKVMSISTTVQEHYVLIAILQESRFYAVRYDIQSGCIGGLANLSQEFLYPGSLMGTNWMGNDLMIWYQDRNDVNIVEFGFKWDDISIDNTG